MLSFSFIHKGKKIDLKPFKFEAVWTKDPTSKGYNRTFSSLASVDFLKDLMNSL